MQARTGGPHSCCWGRHDRNKARQRGDQTTGSTSGTKALHPGRKGPPQPAPQLRRTNAGSTQAATPPQQAGARTEPQQATAQPATNTQTNRQSASETGWGYCEAYLRIISEASQNLSHTSYHCLCALICCNGCKQLAPRGPPTSFSFKGNHVPVPQVSALHH